RQPFQARFEEPQTGQDTFLPFGDLDFAKSLDVFAGEMTPGAEEDARAIPGHFTADCQEPLLLQQADGERLLSLVLGPEDDPGPIALPLGFQKGASDEVGGGRKALPDHRAIAQSDLQLADLPPAVLTVELDAAVRPSLPAVEEPTCDGLSK